MAADIANEVLDPAVIAVRLGEDPADRGPSAVGIIAGERGRDKLVGVTGLTLDGLRARLP